MLVETEGDIEVVGEAKTGREAVDLTLAASSQCCRNGHRHAAAEWPSSDAADP